MSEENQSQGQDLEQDVMSAPNDQGQERTTMFPVSRDDKVAAKPVEKRKYQIKVDGQEEELELDDNEIKTQLQKSRAAEKRFEEDANLRKEALRKHQEQEEFFAQLEKDFRGTIKKHPRFAKLDFATIAEQELLEKLNREAMDPRDLRIQELEAREAEREKQENETKKQREEREAQEKKQALTQERRNAIAKAIGDVLNSPDSPLPQDPRTVARIATYMKYCNDNNIPYTKADVIRQVANDYESDFKTVFPKATPEQIYKLIGEEKFKELLKWNIEKIQGTQNQKKTFQSQPKMNVPQKKKYKTIEEKNLEEHGSLYVFPEDY